MFAVVPEMIFNIPHPIRNRPGKRRFAATKENPSFSDISGPDFRPKIYHVLKRKSRVSGQGVGRHSSD